MSRVFRLSGQEAVTAVTACVGACVLLAAAAAFIERPAHFAATARDLQAELDEAQGTLSKVRDGAPYPIDAVCAVPPDRAAAALSASLEQQARAAGLKVDNLDVAPTGPAGDRGRLQQVRVQLAVEGAYDQVVGFVRRLADVRPQLFVSSADLRSHIDTAALSIQGQVFCANPRQLG